MSKASEYAKAYKERPEFFIQQHSYAVVHYDGRLFFNRHDILNTEQALEFAAWIIDTFGEKND
jgi:hypothetical protein